MRTSRKGEEERGGWEEEGGGEEGGGAEKGLMNDGGGEMEEERGGREEEGGGGRKDGGKKDGGEMEEERGLERERRRWKVLDRMSRCFFWRREKRMVGRRVFFDDGKNFQWKKNLKRRRFSESTKRKRQDLREF